jgi:dTMP kinase
MIDSYLRSKSELDDHAIHLLFSANRWELALVHLIHPSMHYLTFWSEIRASIERDLTAGKIILCDRYAYSGCAFTAAKGLPFEWCRSPDIGLPEPDIVLFLDVSPEVAKTRGGYGDERYENELMQRNVRQIFKDIGASVGQKWVTIDANQTLEEVESKIIDTIEPVLTGALGPIGKLWVA